MRSGQKIVPLDWIEESDRWIVAPGTVLEKDRRRIKQIIHKKNNCLYAAGVPRGIYDFLYRAVKNLGLADRMLIFSRGMVRTPRTRLKYTVSIKELDWAVGTLITIPRLLPYRAMMTVVIEEKEYTLRLMELVVLRGLLMLAVPGKEAKYYPSMAALILSRGWGAMQAKTMPKVYRK